jgi:hypothetical protein
VLDQQVLGEDLVHRPDAGRDSGAGVGETEDLEQLLHRPVLAVAAVHRDERHVGALLPQPPDQVPASVDRDHVVAEPLERVLDAGAGAQRDLALERAAAGEDGDPAHERRARRSRSARRGSSTTRAPSSWLSPAVAASATASWRGGAWAASPVSVP